MTRRTTHLVLAAALALATTACGADNYSGFAGGSDRDDDEDEDDAYECGAAFDACFDYAYAYCGRVEDCGFASYEECKDVLREDGFDCNYAKNHAGDWDRCTDSVEDMSCDEIGNGDFAGTGCDEVSVEFVATQCTYNREDAGGGGGGTEYCLCDGGTPGACAGQGCFWQAYDVANDPYGPGYCTGTRTYC